MTALARLLCTIALLLGLQSGALAHPHILVDAKVRLAFDSEGRLTAIQNSWTFDEAFSVWQTQGLDTNGDGQVSSAEMQDIANDNIAGLAEYGFYTSAGAGDETLPFQATGDQAFSFAGNRSTLDFTIVPATPYVVRSVLDIAIADPEYYVAITIAEPSDVSLENAPAGCSVTLVPGHDMPDDIAARVADLPPDITKLPPDLELAMRGVQGKIRLTCPGVGTDHEVPAATALDAVTKVAETRPSLPFGGPPPEPGFNLPGTGVLGWVRDMQEQFYRGLSGALDRMKQDGSAFFVLGGLSFLYGVFHAAGPGHGKVVIGSYMLANERQWRRGTLLSFLAAMLQSVSAVVFVGVAAAILGLSAMAMNDAVRWLDLASYALIAALGAWLVARRLFGWGHTHGPEPVKLAGQTHQEHAPSGHALNANRSTFTFTPPSSKEVAPVRDAFGRSPGHAHFGHDHADDGDTGLHHHHHHVVTADQVHGDWREQLGVVLGVGIRPCSGALLVLFFAMSQGLMLAGIAAVFLMGLGTAITVSILAAVAIGAKSVAARWLGYNSAAASRVVWWAELGGGVAVLLFGATLLLAALI